VFAFSDLDKILAQQGSIQIFEEKETGKGSRFEKQARRKEEESNRNGFYAKRLERLLHGSGCESQEDRGAE